MTDQSETLAQQILNWWFVAYPEAKCSDAAESVWTQDQCALDALSEIGGVEVNACNREQLEKKYREFANVYKGLKKRIPQLEAG